MVVKTDENSVGVSLHKVDFSMPTISVGMPTKESSFRSLFNVYRTNKENEVVSILKNINLELRHGDRVGIAGKNGAGKTSLLRIIAGIFHPTSGKVTIQGSVRTLFTVNQGFYQSATGYENIWLRALSMGVSLDEIREKTAEISAFCELGNALGRPYSTYSQGMKLRLSSTLATAFGGDIVVLDEWIGAGDAEFKAKFKTRMDEFLENASILVVASNDMSYLKSITNKQITLTKEGNNPASFSE